MTQIALIADDLTGALDSAIPFLRPGREVLVATAPEHLAATLARRPEVVAVSLGSRELSGPEAAARAAEATRALHGVPQLFKKIDSRMKGQIAAEVAAILAIRGLTEALVCPAIPELGRVVEGGLLTGTGVAQPIPVALPGIACRLPDARDASDLDRAIAGCGGALLVGARGLAAALARRTPGAVPALPDLPRPVGFAVGSRDPISLAQVAQLQGAGPAWYPCPDGIAPDLDPTGALILQATPGAGADGATVAARLGAAVATRLDACRTLLLTGGETAAATLAAMGAGTLQLLGEVETGMPVSRALDVPGAPLIVTKSGGFGAADCLLRLLQRCVPTEPQAK